MDKFDSKAYVKDIPFLDRLYIIVINKLRRNKLDSIYKELFKVIKRTQDRSYIL